MRLLLDTNVLSEVTRPRPDAHVLQWLDDLDEDRAFISVVSIAEIRRGVALMERGRKRDALAEWLAQDLPQRFEQRVIPVDQAVAITWGDLMGLAKRSGRGLSSMGGLIAATAIAQDLTLATRNIKDFESLGIELVDPWIELVDPWIERP
ncbi:type II toxin-antitoxin system VapC family toxin [Rhizobium ruizarguesonis]